MSGIKAIAMQTTFYFETARRRRSPMRPHPYRPDGPDCQDCNLPEKNDCHAGEYVIGDTIAIRLRKGPT